MKTVSSGSLRSLDDPERTSLASCDAETFEHLGVRFIVTLNGEDADL